MIKKKERLISLLVIICILCSLFISILLKANMELLVFAGLVLIIITAIIIRYDWIICSIIIFLSLTNLYITFNMGINSKVILVLDYFIIILFCKAIIKLLKRKVKLINPVYILVVIMFFSLLSFVLNPRNGDGVTSLYYNTIRYIILYIGVVYSDISKKQISKIIFGVSTFIIIQAPIVILQTKTLNIIPGLNGISVDGFVLQDFYSGLLGKRSTSELGFLMILNLIFLYYLYIHKKLKLINLLLVFTISILSLVLNETKIVFILLPLILILLNIRNIKMKNIIQMILILIILVNGYSYIGKIYSGQQGILFDKQATLDYINMDYAGSGISRVNGVFVAADNINKSTDKMIIGYGPGKGIKKNNGMYNFRTFYFPSLIYEYGYITFLLYIVFFTIHYYYSKKLSHDNKYDLSILGSVGMALFIIIIFSGFYCMAMHNTSIASVAFILNAFIARYYEQQKNDKLKCN